MGIQESEQSKMRQKWGGWYLWMAENYWYLSDKLQASAQRNQLWLSVIRRFGGNPRSVALGVAEGTILCKVSFPVWGPLELWLILNMFKHQARLRPKLADDD